jgi:hypothetical protein
MCRLHFPLPTLHNTQILKPLLIIYKLQLKAQSIFNKLNEMDMDKGQDVSFDDFLNTL